MPHRFKTTMLLGPALRTNGCGRGWTAACTKTRNGVENPSASIRICWRQPRRDEAANSGTTTRNQVLTDFAGTPEAHIEGGDAASTGSDGSRRATRAACQNRSFSDQSEKPGAV
jgi:hypothetical protein